MTIVEILSLGITAEIITILIIEMDRIFGWLEKLDDDKILSVLVNIFVGGSVYNKLKQENKKYVKKI